MKKGLLLEYHSGEHAAERPHIESVVVLLEVDQQLGSLEVARCDAHVVLSPRVIELSQAPVDQPELSILVIYHHIVRLHISVHDAVGVGVVESLEQLENIISDVKI